MRNEFIYAVADSCRIDVTNLFNLSQKEIVNKFILPRLAGVPRDNVRYNRITGQYMQFIADWGKTCIELDRETGELLMELALQRLSKGAVLHSHTVHLINILPKEYQKYTAAYDEYGLFGREEWNFVVSDLVYCVQNLRTESYRYHAEAILLGLLEHLNPDGSTNKGYMWNDVRYVGVNEAEAYKWAENAALQCLSIDQIAQAFAPSWRNHKEFLKAHQDEIKWDDFFKGVDLNAEEFFTGMTRKMYNSIGIYESKTRNKILSEIKNAA